MGKMKDMLQRLRFRSQHSKCKLFPAILTILSAGNLFYVLSLSEHDYLRSENDVVFGWMVFLCFLYFLVSFGFVLVAGTCRNKFHKWTNEADFVFVGATIIITFSYIVHALTSTVPKDERGYVNFLATLMVAVNAVIGLVFWRWRIARRYGMTEGGTLL